MEIEALATLVVDAAIHLDIGIMKRYLLSCANALASAVGVLITFWGFVAGRRVFAIGLMIVGLSLLPSAWKQPYDFQPAGIQRFALIYSLIIFITGAILFIVSWL